MHGKNCVSIVSFEMTNKLEGSMSDIFYMMVGWSGRLTRMGNQKWQNVVVESTFSDWSSITSGVLQGLLLGPLVCVINDLLRM